MAQTVDSVAEKSIAPIFQRAFPCCTLTDATRLSGGLFNATWRVSLSDGEKYILRVAPEQEHLFSYETHLMMAEQWAYSLCRAQEIPVPDVLLVDASGRYLKRPYMITRCINGMSLHQIPLSKELQTDCYRDAGQMVRKMHSIQGKRFGRLAQQLKEGGFNTWSEAIFFELETWKRTAQPLNLIPNDEITAISHIFKEYSSVLDEIKFPCLVHGDLWNGNILASIDGGKCKFQALIDADHALFGDPEWDFSGEQMLNASFEEGYGKGLDSSKHAYLRRKLYLLLYSMRQCYVFSALLQDGCAASKQKEHITKLLYQLSHM